MSRSQRSALYSVMLVMSNESEPSVGALASNLARLCGSREGFEWGSQVPMRVLRHGRKAQLDARCRQRERSAAGGGADGCPAVLSKRSLSNYHAINDRIVCEMLSCAAQARSSAAAAPDVHCRRGDWHAGHRVAVLCECHVHRCRTPHFRVDSMAWVGPAASLGTV